MDTGEKLKMGNRCKITHFKKCILLSPSHLFPCRRRFSENFRALCRGNPKLRTTPSCFDLLGSSHSSWTEINHGRISNIQNILASSFSPFFLLNPRSCFCSDKSDFMAVVRSNIILIISFQLTDQIWKSVLAGGGVDGDLVNTRMICVRVRVILLLCTCSCNHHLLHSILNPCYLPVRVYHRHMKRSKQLPSTHVCTYLGRYGEKLFFPQTN